MKKKIIRRNKKSVPTSLEDYCNSFWKVYATHCVSYKILDLHKCKEYLKQILAHNATNVLANEMWNRCLEEETVLAVLKQEQNKKCDEMLLVKDQVSSKRTRK